MQISGTSNDITGQIEKKTMDLTKRTEGLINIYNNQMKVLDGKAKQPP